MSPTLKLRVAGALALMAALVPASGALAESKPQCESIAKDVRDSVTKEPSKVLMVVEDSLVINEACACEIVKAAISASHADASLIKQIVQTAVAVAPKMAPIIVECSGTSVDTPADGDTVAKATVVGKDGKQPVAVLPPKEDHSDFTPVGLSDIRGLYLMQPALGGPVVTTNTPPPDVTPPPKKPRPRKPIVTPLSPSCACVP